MKTILFVDRINAHSIWSLVDSIAVGLLNNNYRVIYVRLNNWHGHKPRDVPNGVKVFDITVPEIKRKLDYFLQFKTFSDEFTKILSECKVSIVHCNFADPGIYARYIAKKEKVPIVVSTQHELLSSMSLRLRIGLRLTQKYVDHFVFISKQVNDSFSDMLTSDNKHSIIYNGIDYHRFNDIVRKNITVESNKNDVMIVCSGRLVPVKGQSVLIKSFPSILQEYPDAKLTLIGDGPDKQKLQDLVSDLNLNDKVVFTGWLNREESLKIISESDLVVIPSDGTQEGFGLVLTEAMALSVPIVCSDIPVFNEIANDSVVTFKVNCSESLAESVISSLNNPIISDHFDDKFKETTMVSKYLELYSEFFE